MATDAAEPGPGPGLEHLVALHPAEAPKTRPADEFRDELQGLSRRVAFAPQTWSTEDFHRVKTAFDERAPNWVERRSPAYLAPLADAISRGGLAPGGRCLEIGSGTGLQTATLVSHFAQVVSIDVSFEMLSRAEPSGAKLVSSDGAALSFGAASFDVIVLVNMFVFAAEYLRVLAQDGFIVLASTRGPLTPIYLAPQDLLECLELFGSMPFYGRHAQVGEGEWTALSRHPREPNLKGGRS